MLNRADELREFLLTVRRVTIKEALEMGLVSRVEDLVLDVAVETAYNSLGHITYDADSEWLSLILNKSVT